MTAFASRFLPTLGFLVSLFSGPSALEAAEKAELVAGAVERYIRPAYATLHGEAADMDAAMGRLCATPGTRSLQAAREQFTDLVDAWSRVEFVRFGPIMEENRADRLLFFPDRRGLGLRQMQAILAERDAGATSVEGLAQKSVAVQGLGTLDYILAGRDAEALTSEAGAFRCAFGRAVAGNILAMAGAVDAAWAAPDGIARRLTQPSAGDPNYRRTEDSLQEIFGIFIHGLEAMRDLRLKPPLGESEMDAKPGLFLFTRSGNTIASLKGNFAGMQTLLEAMDVAPLLPAEEAYAPASADFELDNAVRTLTGLRQPTRSELTPADRQAFLYVLIVTQSLQDLFANHIALNLGLSAGFSALDGD